MPEDGLTFEEYEVTVRGRHLWNANMLFTSDGDWLIEVYEAVSVGKERPSRQGNVDVPGSHGTRGRSGPMDEAGPIDAGAIDVNVPIVMTTQIGKATAAARAPASA